MLQVVALLQVVAAREVSCHTAWLTWHSLERTTLSLLPASPRRQLVIGKMGMPKSEHSPKPSMRTRFLVYR